MHMEAPAYEFDDEWGDEEDEEAAAEENANGAAAEAPVQVNGAGDFTAAASAIESDVEGDDTARVKQTAAAGAAGTPPPAAAKLLGAAKSVLSVLGRFIGTAPEDSDAGSPTSPKPIEPIAAAPAPVPAAPLESPRPVAVTGGSTGSAGTAAVRSENQPAAAEDESAPAAIPSSAASTAAPSALIPVVSVPGGFQICTTFKAHLLSEYYGDTTKGTAGSVNLATAPPVNPALFVRRIQSEWKSLKKNLMPDVLVKVNEGQPNQLKFAIIGALHTPYYQSFLPFDVLLPPNYPQGPPVTRFHARGVRLNPNLYDNGYVCLSLLGTWEGHAECERWNAATSNLQQVMMSAQAIILCREPWYNEAGYEAYFGTEKGVRESRIYNESIALLRLHHMVMLGQQPPADWVFEFRAHYTRVVPLMLERFRRYLAEARTGAAPTISTTATAAAASAPTAAAGTADAGGAAAAASSAAVAGSQPQLQVGVMNADGLILPLSAGFRRSLQMHLDVLQRQYDALVPVWKAEMEANEAAFAGEEDE
jgi:ubiquitin-conjugating enzyme E2 O